MSSYTPKNITLLQPPKIVAGEGALDVFINDIAERRFKKVYVVTIPLIQKQLSLQWNRLTGQGIEIEFYTEVKGEPTFKDLEIILKKAKRFEADSVVGIGGGSILDLAKLVSVQLYNDQSIQDICGIGNLKRRDTYLACLPTTSGTGSEVSPNAIMLNDANEKIGIISPFLLPDATYIDPLLTLTLPPFVTAITGIDALSHCIEAYTNKFAHPLIDAIALNGIGLIFKNLSNAISNGNNIEARAALSLGSMYGGMCLGPVNTAAAHALAYPLATKYKMAHGLSIALLLPAVMRYNAVAVPEKYASLHTYAGVSTEGSDYGTAMSVADAVEKLIIQCGIRLSLKKNGVSRESISVMAEESMKVQRLLKNNPREITKEDAKKIYEAAYN
ncbi:MAG: iron-containing alcohol dehydrogenase [Ginsengibacter sp.]